jgi:membrane-bound lytic murein transglycosylase B
MRLSPLPLLACLLIPACASQSATSAPAAPAATAAPVTAEATPAATVAPAAPTPVTEVAAAEQAAATAAAATDLAARLDAFANEVSTRQNLPREEVLGWLRQAQYRQSIVDAMNRPAEAKPWREYRPIFLTEARIRDGRAFLAQHRAELQRVSGQTGVPPEFIVAIIGVETSYGRITGNYRVLDAIYTLAFFYPRREVFFRGELEQLFALRHEENLDLAQIKGSYAGAMGWGQFMPSSYRNYARDGNGDGRRDLFGSLPDVFASVANYFVAHGWQRGQPVMARAQAGAEAQPFVPENWEPNFSSAQLAEKGYRRADGGDPGLPATLVTLEGAAGTEHWIAYRNFHVITRYNRSPLYATAVTQLAEAIAAP